MKTTTRAAKASAQAQPARVFHSGHRIWPGPECLKSRPFAVGDPVRVIGSGHISKGVVGKVERLVIVDGTDASGQPIRCAFYPESLRHDTAAAEQRARGIALAHERAKARKYRWMQWCADRMACRGGMAFAAVRWTPEQAVLDAANSDEERHRLNVQWVARRLSFGWDDAVAAARWVDFERRLAGPRSRLAKITRSMLRSPEWLSLPWQRDPSEVAHG